MQPAKTSPLLPNVAQWERKTREGCSTKPSGEIILCDQRFAIDWPVVNWHDDSFYDASRITKVPTKPFPGQENATQRFGKRHELAGSRSLRHLQQVIQQFVVHYDGLESSRDCFHVLQDERGLSCHFLIDNDGTIYQTLDLVHRAFHAKGVNGTSIGVEICSRGALRPNERDYYQRRRQQRNLVQTKVHRHSFEMWDFTECQYQAMFALGRAFARLLPNLPQVFPARNGELIRTWIAGVERFGGYLGHYHVSENKPDPGSFDFKRLAENIKARPVWFVRPPDSPDDNEPPQFPEDEGKVRAQAAAIIGSNEQQAMGGFYPVGPYLRSRLWHGGIHLPLSPSAPIYAPAGGSIAAARYGAVASIGSVNFVLTRHQVELQGREVTFHLLFLHLLGEDPDSTQTPWLRAAMTRPYSGELRSGRVAFPRYPIAAGDIIGHAGPAGPDPEQWEHQVHVQALAGEEITAALTPGYFTVLDAKGSGLFCDLPEILNPIDTAPRDGLLSAHELRRFFRESPDRDKVRRMAIRFQSEFGNTDDYLLQLRRSPDFNTLSLSKQRNLFRAQIEPTLWLSEVVARELNLPTDFQIWHYHPVEFLLWLDRNLRQSVVRDAVPLESGAPLELDPHAGTNDFLAAGDRPNTEREWTLDDFVHGYPESD